MKSTTVILPCCVGNVCVDIIGAYSGSPADWIEVKSIAICEYTCYC